MLPGLLALLLALLNLGGLASVFLHLGRGEWRPALGSLAVVVLLDVVGFWLLRELRENG
ncbi:hypothetical protein DAERI_010545 [Deinococcus aerius]|uniref:Uncharacterized protein n=1 Tax=Deinococcus aerius TaxID=200253 RepID=A0A2I9CS00_9DEIO|nr:hypothetical protein [Deinococcus aerius]GBF04373.1 hypothetical protein DAERI_010545 [Deinococcus aerius]